MRFYKVSWDELNRDCLKLYNKIKHLKIDRILCISRGGLVWARMFSDLLNIPVSHLTAISYTGIHQRKDVKITELPNHGYLKNQVLLVVDEIGDHGKTLAAVNKFLKSIKIKKFYSLSPIIREYTDPKPDFYLHIKKEWIIFPYIIVYNAGLMVKNIFFGAEKSGKKLHALLFENLSYFLILVKKLML